MKITADEVQFAYPNVSYYPGNTYCVGGALCAYLNDLKLWKTRWKSYPGLFDLIPALQTANPDLGFWEAKNFAVRITNGNDQGHFDEAWLALREALKWEPE